MLDLYILQLKIAVTVACLLFLVFEIIPTFFGAQSKIKENVGDFLKYQIGIGIYAVTVWFFLAVIIYSLNFDIGIFGINSLPIIVQVTLLFVCSEFFIYLFHLCAHKYKIPILSKAHWFHHLVTTDMDWVNGRKEHPYIIALFMAVFVFIFIVIFESTYQAQIVTVTMYILLNAFSHYRIPVTVFGFDKIFLFPKHHFQHHTEHGGPYGVTLSVFDTIFNTRG